ncbi:MAG: peptidase M28 [Candidatus Rokuibacteriota bacterium]|nr:MAG: peptidase M28 [Candidatus Rokubacteria bacterium]
MPRPTPIIRKVLVTAAVLLAALAGGLVYVVQPIGWRSSGARPDGVDPVRLEAHVRMLAETLAPRHWKRQDNLDRAAAYVAARLGEAGARVTEQVYAVEAAGRYRNVIGSFGPEAGERVIVGAHYDGAGPFAAADDNASGVAGLLELARLLGTGRTPATRVDLVAFTLEEPPYYDTEWMGSHVHAAALRREGVAVRAMIALEMIGYFSDAPGSQRLPHLLLRVVYPSTGNFVAVIGRLGEAQLARRVKRAMQDATDLDVYSMNAPAWIPGIDFSDHRSYWAQGYPAVMVTDTAFYRNDRYHTPRDTPDTLDYRRMADVVRGVHRAVLTLAR